MNVRIASALAGLMTLFSFSPMATAADKPAKAQTCVGCHGPNGNSLVPTYPKLAGQHAAYLEKSLKDFRDGHRKNATMEPFAKGLTDEEIKALADYYAAQTQS
ncbi:cytochrome c [Thiomicrospira sp. WB1]|jgi:cytochrome c553|uniref:c-type cytochrome n=1 Tax=Thiomicrospira sp. WB1 TaxID=1685380 RepID=UPI000747A332|nr:cytochrome c [Thiomicrospira sp. WB1]KUJ72724.1 cytochrome C [Thiomicrospira sp. WB1]